MKLKKNIYLFTVSTSRFFSKINQGFSNYIPIHKLPDNLNEEDLKSSIEEIVNHKDFEKSDPEIETYVSMEGLNYPQEYDSDFPIFNI